MNSTLLLAKLERLRAGKRPRVLDLFAGCGGISLGFEAAGFEIKAAVEFDPAAARSHGLNFHGGAPEHSVPIDITQTTPSQFAERLGLPTVAQEFDVIVGGPPCQAFARVGRSKLREVDEHPQAVHPRPARRPVPANTSATWTSSRPLAVLMENVPDVLNHGGQNIAEEICEVLTARGMCRYTLLNAAFYGVPQMRERMIPHRRTAGNWRRRSTFRPRRIGSSCHPATKARDRSRSRRSTWRWWAMRMPTCKLLPRREDLPPAVTAEDALADLPPIYARDLLELAAAAWSASVRPNLSGMTTPKEAFAIRDQDADLARPWHAVGRHPRPRHPLSATRLRLFARMNPATSTPRRTARDRAFEERLAARRAAGEACGERRQITRRLRQGNLPPYDASKFPNKWRKMWRTSRRGP